MLSLTSNEETGGLIWTVVERWKESGGTSLVGALRKNGESLRDPGVQIDVNATIIYEGVSHNA